jgi:methyl-accepting chemotaxis protein
MTEPRPTGNPTHEAGDPDGTGAATAEARWTHRSIWLGRGIVVCAVVATLVTLVLVERFATTYQDGLDVTTESAELVAESVEPAQILAADLSELADSLVAGIDETRAVVATTGDTLGALGDASTTNLADTADGAAGVADDLAGVLETIERFIPGDTDSVAEELRTLADGLEPVADQLRELGGRLQSGSDQLTDADATLERLSVSVAEVARGLDRLGPTFAELEATSADLAERAQDASDRVDVDLWLLRLVVIVLGVALACAGLAIERFARHLAQGSASVAVDGRD